MSSAYSDAMGSDGIDFDELRRKVAEAKRLADKPAATGSEESTVKLVKELEHHLNSLRLQCSCVNWTGGCSREDGCSYGHVIDALTVLKKLKAGTGDERNEPLRPSIRT